jgi:hypothetical protein
LLVDRKFLQKFPLLDYTYQPSPLEGEVEYLNSPNVASLDFGTLLAFKRGIDFCTWQGSTKLEILKDYTARATSLSKVFTLAKTLKEIKKVI